MVHCVCHRLALILTDAITSKGSKSCAKVIPDEAINLMTMLYEYFSRSPARKKAMRDFLAVENEASNQRRRRERLQPGRGRRRGGAAPTRTREQPNPVDELERIVALLEERHKLPRRIVLTRWLSCAEAVRVVLNCRDMYTILFNNEETDKAQDILELLEDSSIIAWYACMQDVPTRPHWTECAFPIQPSTAAFVILKIQTAKAALINMVGHGGVRTEIIPLGFGAFTNKFITDHSGLAAITGTGTRLYPEQILQLKQSFYRLYVHSWSK